MADLRSTQTDCFPLFNEMLGGFGLHQIICDASGAPVDYRFLALNLAFEWMTGLTAAAVVGRTILRCLGHEFRPGAPSTNVSEEQGTGSSLEHQELKRDS